MGIIADGNGYCHKAARVMEIGYSLLNPFHPYVVSISYPVSITGEAKIIGRIPYSTSLKSLAGCLHQGQMKSAGSSSPS